MLLKHWSSESGWSYKYIYAALLSLCLKVRLVIAVIFLITQSDTPFILVFMLHSGTSYSIIFSFKRSLEVAVIFIFFLSREV